MHIGEEKQMHIKTLVPEQTKGQKGFTAVNTYDVAILFVGAVGLGSSSFCVTSSAAQ